MIISAPATIAATLIFVFTMVHAAVTDLTTYKIRNGLVLVFVLAYALLAPLAGFGLHQIASSAAVAALVLVFGVMLFAFGLIGGGDAKLAAATALWVGADCTLAYLLYMSIIGGALTLAILQFRLITLPVRLQSRSWLTRLHTREAEIPYGVAMALAALVVLPKTHWMTAIT
jgi:prepilin peptidase CpaA